LARKVIDAILMISMYSIILQSLGKIVLRAPTVGAKYDVCSFSVCHIN